MITYKKKKFKIMDNKFWIPILKELNFPEEKYNILIEYIQRHTRYEINGSLSILKNKSPLEEISTLPMALTILSKLNLDKVHFIDAPILESKDGKPYQAETIGVGYEINHDELHLVNDIELHISNQLIEKTLKFLNEKLETEYLYIYVLFDTIKKFDNGQLMATHRFFTSTEILKFNKSYLIFYLKQIGSETNSEIKLDIEQKLIPEEKKENFLEFLNEIDNRVPREDEIRIWFEKEKIVF